MDEQPGSCTITANSIAIHYFRNACQNENGVKEHRAVLNNVVFVQCNEEVYTNAMLKATCLSDLRQARIYKIQ